MSLREKILDVSRELLIRQGFSKISMRKIAAKADVSATSIYLYFKNKDELLLTLIEESIRHLNIELSRAAEINHDPISKLESMAHAYVDFALKNPQQYEIIYMVRPEEMPKFPKEKFQAIRSIYELLAVIIDQVKAETEVRIERSLTSAYTFWAQLHGVVTVILSKRLDTRIPKQEFIEQAIEHTIRGFVYKKIPV